MATRTPRRARCDARVPPDAPDPTMTTSKVSDCVSTMAMCILLVNEGSPRCGDGDRYNALIEDILDVRARRGHGHPRPPVCVRAGGEERSSRGTGRGEGTR